MTGVQNRYLHLLSCIFHLNILLGFGFPFKDLSKYAGLERQNGVQKKYGGAVVADLNGDGWPDLLCGHHDDSAFQVYFNNGNGTFTLSPFHFFSDTHGLNPFRPYPKHKTMYFLHSQGGSRGANPNPPTLQNVSEYRAISIITNKSPDLAHTYRRGRTAIVLSMKMDPKRKWARAPRPDLLLLNRIDSRGNHNRAFQISETGELQERKLVPWTLRNSINNYGGITDIDGDGIMEVVLLNEMTIWKLKKSFAFWDISRRVLPSKRGIFGLQSFAELDYDNDGYFDLFLVRSSAGHHHWLKKRPVHDNLLRNVNGKHYVDRTSSAGIPIGSNMDSHGVTVGDFDNDGYIDIFIVRFASNPMYLLLKNLGNGKFIEAKHGILSSRQVNGDMATAVDYNRDGRIDLILSEGNWGRIDLPISGRGFYRVMKNNCRNGNGFLLVRVRSAPRFTATSLHAVVTVRVNNTFAMYRRVGSPSTMVSNSYIELVHFGMGLNLQAQSVSVRWTDGTVETKVKLKVNSTIEFGLS